MSISKKVAYPLMTALTLSACVPYPHSVTRNPAIEGRVLSAETGQAVADARIELDIGSDESWRYETSSDSEGRFAFAKHRDYRLFALLADGPHCRTDIKVNAPGYHTRHCIWISSYGCSSAPIKISGLMLRPEHMAVSEIESVEGYWLCLESAKEQAH
ncbi:hypothetical protein SAMN05878276_2633 [Aquipseudomonas alcaligenes]|nr:hypothetical protein SAMN05878276_2633 [Pseudomonas alcaligenes]